MREFFLLLCASLVMRVSAADESPVTRATLRQEGVFGFPQGRAKVLCNGRSLRFSAWSNKQYLFAQAVLWTDDDASLGKDWSVLMLDVNADGKSTFGVDRDYVLTQEGRLGYVIEHGWRTQTGIYTSKGRGGIRYIKTAGGRLVRVDTFLIPLSEISRHVGDIVRLAYWGFSAKPPLTVNSTTYTSAGKNYSRWAMPRSGYNEYILASGGRIDPNQVPEGVSQHGPGPMPKVGQAAPEIAARDWINSLRPLTLASFRGKVVVLDFWATWCGPCVECIPHLNELQLKYSGEGLQVLSLVTEGRKTMAPFLAKGHVDYPIGLESSSLDAYGITEIPQAFVIGRGGKILWRGDPASPQMDKVIAKALRSRQTPTWPSKRQGSPATSPARQSARDR